MEHPNAIEFRRIWVGVRNMLGTTSYIRVDKIVAVTPTVEGKTCNIYLDLIDKGNVLRCKCSAEEVYKKIKEA
jgi:type IV secretory pathway VirB6-like protein